MKVGIDKAREICNVVRKNFPYESPWMQANAKYRDLLAGENWVIDPKLREIRNRVVKSQDKIQEVRDCYQVFDDQPFKYFRELISAVRIFEVQNCGELSRITYAILRMNGVKNKDINVASLVASEKKEEHKGLFPAVDKFFEIMREFENLNLVREIDHVATQICGNADDRIVLDNLFNECDTKNNMEKVYKTKYGDILQVNPKEEVNLVNYETFPRLKDNEVKELKRMYPEFVIEKKDLGKSKNFFFDWLKR